MESSQKQSSKTNSPEGDHNPSEGGHDVFDIRRVRQLVRIMHENNLAEINLEQGKMRIQLKSNTASPPALFPPLSMSPAPSPAPAHVVPQSPPSPASVSVDESQFIFVKSPMVGTFYSSPNPDSPPFVKVGDTVGPETIVCILEAMKVFNEIAAECSGKIVAILVKNGEPVEFGKPLFKIDPR